MAAEDAMHVTLLGVGERAGGHFVGESKPHSIKSLQETDNALLSKRELLQLLVNRRKEIADEAVVHHEAVELMAVNGQMADATGRPLIFLIDLDADQVGHDFAQAVVVIALDPNHFHAAFRVRKLANVTEKLPVFFLEAAEVEVAEYIAQKDETAKGNPLQHLQRSLRTADLRTQMQVREDYRVVTRRIHACIVENWC